MAPGSDVQAQKSRWHSHGEGGGEVNLDTVIQHALAEEVDGGKDHKVGAVRLVSASSAAFAINDSQARVARPGEGTRLGVAREDSDLL